MGKTVCSEGVIRDAAATMARAKPQIAPKGKSVRPTKPEARRTQQTGKSDEPPGRGEREASTQRRADYWHHKGCYSDVRLIIILCDYPCPT